MEFFKQTTFWIGFSLALLATLLIGGLISAVLSKCPAFGPLLIVSVGVALLSGLIAQQLVGSKIKARVEPIAERLSAARERLSVDSLEDRITRAREQLARLSQ